MHILFRTVIWLPIFCINGICQNGIFKKKTLSIHKKKDTPDLSATVGRGMKPKIQGGGSMATFSVVPDPILLLNIDCVKRPLDMLL
jgi:hypothetical protein